MNELKTRWQEPATQFHEIRESILAGKKLVDLSPPKLNNGRYDLRYIDLKSAVGLSGYDFSDSDLEGADFERSVLRGARFNDSHLAGASFIQADLTNAQFMSASLQDATFSKAVCEGANFFGSDLYKSKFQEAGLVDANFEDCILRSINLNHVVLREARGFLGKNLSEKIRDERIQDWEGAAGVYLQLKQSLELSGSRHEAGRLFYKWRCCRRRTLSRPKSWIDALCYIVMGYGEKPLRVVVWALILILSWAFYYAATDLYFIEEGAKLSHDQLHPLSDSRSDDMGLCEAVYFSIVTFTTLGYGDISPSVDRIRQAEKAFPKFLQKPVRALVLWIPAIEAFVGAFFMSLFAVVFARVIIR